MSERGVGVVERELLDRARDAEMARHRDYYARLELVAELDRWGVAVVTGFGGTVRLLQFPGCSRPPRRCHAHHLRHWLEGGDTAVENMCLLCRFHHQLIHHGHWTVTMVDGRPWFTPPDWTDPDRRPRPGGRPRVAA